MSSKLVCVVLIAIFFTSLSSCSIFRRSARKTIPVDTTLVAAPPLDTSKTNTEASLSNINIEKQNLIAALTPLWNKQIQFNTFSGKAKCHYEGKGDKQEFTANIRIKKDSIIWVSVTALGGIVQVARIYITTDTVKLINYLQKEITIMPLSEAGKILPAPADFSVLQNLIVGNVLRQSGAPNDATDFGGTLSLQVEENNFIQQVTYNKSDSTMRSLQMRTTVANGPIGVIQYGNYEKTDDQKIPMSRAVNVINAGEQYYLDMNFTKIDLNQPLDFPFSIPRGYNNK